MNLEIAVIRRLGYGCGVNPQFTFDEENNPNLCIILRFGVSH